MLIPKPLILKKEMEAHAHAAGHDDVHNEKSIPLQEKALDHEAQALVPSHGTPDPEKALQEVEY